MPTYEVTGPDGTVIEIDGDRQPTEDELRRIFRSAKDYMQDQAVAGMDGEKLLAYAKENPGVELSDKAYRKIYDYQEGKKTDWAKEATDFAKAVPGAVFTGIGSMLSGAFRAVTEDVPSLLGEATVDPALAAKKAALTVGEFGQRQAAEIEMLPPAYLAQRMILDSQIPSFDSWYSDRAKKSKGQLPYEAGTLERTNQNAFRSLKDEYDGFKDNKRYQNWKSVFFKKQADALKAAKVESGETSYIAEASGGKGAMESAVGTSEIYSNAAQAMTDLFGIDAIPPVVSTLGRKVATKIPGTDRLFTRAASKVAEKAGEALDTASRVAGQFKDIGPMSESLDLLIIGAPLSAAGKTMEIKADVIRAAAAVASGVGSEAALRQVRSKAARVALSPFNNNLVEKIVRNGAQALDELVPAGITGGIVGTAMAIGAESGEEAGQIVGGQIGSGMAMGSGVAATVGAQRIADFNKANTLLSRLSEDERRGLLARRIAMHQSSHGEMAGEVAIREIADVARTQEALAIEGERIKLMTADEIAVFAAVIGQDPAKAASSQGFFATDPNTGGRVMVVNTDRSVNLAKTARHEVLHSLKEAQSATVPPSVLERMRQAYNDDTLDPATFRDETQKLYSDVFGVYDESGRQLEDGIVSQDDLDRMVRAYLARLHGDDTVAINQAMSVGERPMNSRELVDRFGDELFARIAEDFDLSSRKAGVVQSLLAGIAKKTGVATVFNAVSARLSLLRQALARQGVNPLVDDLDRISDNPVIRGMVNEYLQMRKALQVELVREPSSLAANVSVKNTLKGGEDVASRKRRTKRVNDLAAFGRLETNDAGEVLAQSGAVYSGELSDPPKVISQADASRRERSTSEAITKTLEGLGDQPGGMTLVDSDKPYWVGVPNEAQMAAIEGLPNSVVPDRIKKALRIAVNAVRGEGNTLAFDYYKALTGGKYDARAEMRYNIVQPFSFRVSKAGNFLMQVFDIAKLNEKISGWKKRNPKYFDVWSTEEDPSGLSGLRNEIKAALERQRQGIKNNEGNTKGYKKILELLNIDSLDIDPASGGKRSMIQSRRIDRIGGEVQVGEPGWMIDYGRFKSPASFMPDPSRGSSINMERLSELGFTEDIREAGYLTTDGKYIDLSGKREGGQPGTRSYDHREAGGTSGMMEFMAEGNIRLSPEGGMLDIMRQPTPSQESRLKAWMESFGGNVVVDLSDGLGKWDDRNNGYLPSERRTYMEFPDGTKPAKVLGMIRRFYSGEDIDSGIRFMPGDELRINNDKDVPAAYKQSRPNTRARMLGTGRIYSPAVAKMVSDEMKGKEINREELDRIIERDIPIRPVTPPKTKMDLPSVDEIKDALNEKQAVDAHADATEVFDVGDQVTLRQDVPSWNRAGVGVVTVRGSGGDVAYVPMVRVDNLMLYPTASEQASAARIASGAGKVPTIKATGTIAKTQALPTNLSRWQQVGFNPDRHSYYYLRSGDQKGRPVVAAQEAVQIGNTIFVRGQITYGDRAEFKYSPDAAGEQAPSRVKGDAAKRVKTSAINLLYSKQGDVAEGVTSIPGVAKLLKDMAEEQWGGKITSATITPEQEAAIVDNAADEVFAALEAEGENAGDWYTESVKRAVKVMGVIFPEIVDDEAAMKTGFFGSSDDAALGMMMAMAVTSQNLKVSDNTKYAVEQFRHLLKTGKFNHKKSYGGKAESISGNLALANKIVDQLGWSGANDFLAKEFTVAELIAECKRIGLDTSISGKVDDVVNGALILGPKIGQGFLQNLLGRFDPVTIDLWMRRTWGRWTGDVMAESFSGEQVARLIDAMNESGDRLPAVLSGIKPITGQRASTGSKFRTLSESDLNKVRADESAVFEFAKSKVSQWDKLFKSMSFPVRKTVYDSWRKGDITADQMIVEIQADIASAKKYIKDNKVKAEWDAAGKKWNSDSAAKQIMKGRADTVLLTKEQKKGIKPEWAFASKVIKDLLGPIDIPSNMDREVITRVVNKIRKRVEASGFRTTNADIQAILWYPEKDLWNNLANKKADKLKSAYDIEFLKIADELGLGDEARKQIR